MPTNRKRRSGKTLMGLRIGEEDLKWLTQVASEGERDTPGFNRSRLIALGLAETGASGLSVTEKGRALLAKRS